MLDSPTSSARPGPAGGASTGRRRWRLLALVVLGLAVLAVLLALVFEAEIGSATVGLTVAGGALVLCLHSLYHMVQALSRPSLETVVDREAELAMSGKRALREERRRVLRAINELEFDHAMGKLSEEDYRKVREGYELRAIEVMRALDAEPSLDAELTRELRRRGLMEGDAPEPSEAEPAAEPTPGSEPAPRSEERRCSACEGENDLDARFCKHCGGRLGQ